MNHLDPNAVAQWNGFQPISMPYWMECDGTHQSTSKMDKSFSVYYNQRIKYKNFKWQIFIPSCSNLHCRVHADRSIHRRNWADECFFVRIPMASKCLNRNLTKWLKRCSAFSCHHPLKWALWRNGNFSPNCEISGWLRRGAPHCPHRSDWYQ